MSALLPGGRRIPPWHALICAASLGPPWRCLPPRRGALLAGEHPRAEPPGRGRPRAAPLGMCLRAGRAPARSSAVIENLMVNLPASKSRCFVLLTAGSFQLSLVAPDRGVSRPAFGGEGAGEMRGIWPAFRRICWGWFKAFYGWAQGKYCLLLSSVPSASPNDRGF